jgi:electron transfer flavoprotein beta subunit
MMKIVVPIKRVVDPYAKVKPSADGLSVDVSTVKFEINPFDEIALEEAIRIREKLGSVNVIVVSIGPPEAEEQLRKALAMGAEEAFLIETHDAPDSFAVARELAEFVKQQQPDLVIMGKQATDDDSNQAGQILAQLLGWPKATFAAKIEVADGKVTVTRETDSGEETVEAPLPCLITADLRLNEPRYIALPAIIQAKRKPLTKQAPATAIANRVKVVAVEAPPARPPGRKVGSTAELVETLKSMGALN